MIASFPLLRGFSCYLQVAKDVLKVLGECGVVEFQEIGREAIWPNSVPV